MKRRRRPQNQQRHFTRPSGESDWLSTRVQHCSRELAGEFNTNLDEFPVKRSSQITLVSSAFVHRRVVTRQSLEATKPALERRAAETAEIRRGDVALIVTNARAENHYILLIPSIPGFLSPEEKPRFETGWLQFRKFQHTPPPVPDPLSSYLGNTWVVL